MTDSASRHSALAAPCLRRAPRPRQPKPDWLKVRAPGSPSYTAPEGLMRELNLHTVCEEAQCPNIGECWNHGTATFMILGDVCTRACSYCAVAHGRPAAVDTAEPVRVADAIRTLDLSYVVITSVDRDDLPDGGASIFAETIRETRARLPALPHRSADPRLPGQRSGAAHRARRAARRAQPQHRNGAAAVSHGALRRPLRAHAGTARSLAPLRAGHPDQDRRDGRPRRRARRTDRDVPGSARRRLRHPDDRPVPAPDRRARADGPLLPSRRIRRPQTGRRSTWASCHVESGPLVRSSYHAHETADAYAQLARAQ